jgi:hypothetical protein
MLCNKTLVCHTPAVQGGTGQPLARYMRTQPRSQSRNVACAYAIRYLCHLCAFLPVLLTAHVNSVVACSTIMFKYTVNTICNTKLRLPSEFISALRGGFKPHIRTLNFIKSNCKFLINRKRHSYGIRRTHS